MNEAYEVFGDRADDVAGFAHAIMSSLQERVAQNTNDGVRTAFATYEPDFSPNTPYRF